VPIAGATGSTYTLRAADAGARIVVIASASNPDGTVKAVSAPTAVVLPAASKTAATATVAVASAKTVLRAVGGQALARVSLAGRIVSVNRADTGGTMRVWVLSAAGGELTAQVPAQGVRLRLPAAMSRGPLTVAVARVR
jgi:hypothetical protein